MADLPEGTSISAIVKAKNIIGESTVESNTVMPQLPNPEGAAGPITATTETELTVGVSVHLDEFVDNDSLVMVDETGAVTSYTPETSAITGVGDVPGGWNAVSIPTATWREIAYGANTFVAVGSGDAIHSPDGINWTTSSMPSGTAGNYYGVTSNAKDSSSGTFVAVSASAGANNAVIYSTDRGASWDWQWRT